MAGILAPLAMESGAQAQDLGPHIRTVAPGIHVYSRNPIDSNCTIILTNDGVVLIDSGHNPPDSHNVLAAVRTLTKRPVRMLINTEPHSDHTTGHFLFSPPAIIVAAKGATESMRKAFNPKRFETLASPEMKKAAEGYRLVTPHVEFHERMTLSVGERSFELYHLHAVHSEADTAIWLPQERILFTAASISVGRFNNLRSFVSIPETMRAITMMKALNPAIVIPGHGAPGTAALLDDAERYYTLLVSRVRALVEQGRSLDQIKAELKMPEYDKWVGRDRFNNNVEAAYRAVKGG